MFAKIRNAKKEDFAKIFNLINELAKFEKLEPPDFNSGQRLFNDAFGSKPSFKVLVAETIKEKEIIGYVFYFFTYSSFLARKTLYLEDIFVTESKRGLGIGKLFFDKLAETAKKEGCGRMEWSVLDWNENAIKFYNKIGARPLSEWIYYRLNVQS